MNKYSAVIILLAIANVCFSQEDDIRIEPRIQGGHKTNIRRFPYMVNIFYNEDKLCGGFIVTPWHIVTAARCVRSCENPNHLLVQGGSTYLDYGDCIRIANFTMHPLYNPCMDPYDYDVAVLQTEKMMQFDSRMNMVALPEEGEMPVPESMIEISGWGSTGEYDYYSDELMMVTLVAHDAATCNTTDHMGEMTENMFCAGNCMGRAACWGDTGGAGIQNYTAYGIILSAPACGHPTRSTLFTNVASPPIRDFIRSQTGV